MKRSPSQLAPVALALLLAGCESAVPTWSANPSHFALAAPTQAIPVPPATPSAVVTPAPTPTAALATAKAPPPTPARALVVGSGNRLGTRRYAVRDTTIAVGGFVQAVPQGQPLLPISASAYLLDTTSLADIEGATWLVDVDDGASRIATTETVLDVDPKAGNLLINDGSRLVVRDLSATDVAWTPASPKQAAFLADGSVAWMDASNLDHWLPATGTTTSSLVGSGFSDGTVVAAGTNVMVAHADGAAALFDPATGAQIGTRWTQGNLASISASPDGTKFALGAQSEEEIRPTLQIRDATSGSLLDSSVQPNDERGYIESVAWVTDNVLLVIRTVTGTEVEPTAELRLATDLSVVAAIDPIVPYMTIRGQRGQLLLVGGWGDEVLLLHANEAVP